MAVDPGTSGGMAWEDGTGRVHAIQNPEDQGTFAQEIQRINSEAINEGAVIVAYVEKITGFIKKPKAGEEEKPGFRLEDQAHRMFTFGKSYGIILGILAANMMEVVEVAPVTWQKGFPPRAGRDRSAWKNLLKARAQAAFPSMKVTLGTADALLILNYARGLLKPDNQGSLL